MPEPYNPQNLNRYSYVNNNPLRYTDPTGHMLDYGGNEGGGGCNSITCFPQAPSNPSSGGGGGSTLTPANTPTPSTTPCPQALVVCLPTATNTPTIVNTPTPTGTPTLPVGPMYTNYSTPPRPYLDWYFYIDWSRVDKIDLGIDLVGIGADLASLLPPAAPVAQTIGTTAEGVGFIKSSIELIQGNPQSMLVSQTTRTAKWTVMIFRAERMIPIPLVGTVGNLVSLGINTQPQFHFEWVTP